MDPSFRYNLRHLLGLTAFASLFFAVCRLEPWGPVFGMVVLFWAALVIVLLFALNTLG